MARLFGTRKQVRDALEGAGLSRPLRGRHPAVQVEGVTKIYNEDTPQQLLALDNISMEIAQGEVVALLGPSGCGKSTLLKMIGGLYPATSGRIFVDGVPVTEPGELTGMMFQKPVLFPWLKVVDNVLLPARTQGAKRSEFLDRANDLIALAGLQGFEESYPWELSGGMQQRVAICRMLMGEPKVLLLDEPFGALDEMTREYMDLELRRIIIRQNRSALLVTHNPLEAAFIGDRVVVMTTRPGKIAGEVEVPLGKDRSEDLLASDELNVYIREARSLLELAKDSLGRPL
jgi:NitT/TauT family transport system ATP-binding protein